MRKIVVTGLIIAGVVGGGWWAWTRTGLREKIMPARNGGNSIPRTATVQRRDIVSTVEAVGDINPANQVAIKSEVNGRIKSIAVVTGQQVHKDELMVSLDDTDLLTERDAAVTEIEGTRVRMEKARRDFDRNQELFTDKLVSREMFDNARTELDLSKNELAKAEKRLQGVDDKLKKIRILAPFDGTVLSVLVTPGQVVSGATGVNQGTDLLMLADLNQMVIRTHINQVDVTKLKVGLEAKIVVDSIADKKLTGRVTLIAPVATVKNDVKGFDVDVLITKGDPLIRPGMNANLTFDVARAENVLAVPLAAVFVEEGKRLVYIQDGTTPPAARTVETGTADYRYCQLLSGVKEGETVLLEKPSPAKPSR
jgi:RND family efflux transporter MFP subunit